MKGVVLVIWQSGKALLQFNDAAERSRQDPCWWRDNLLKKGLWAFSSAEERCEEERTRGYASFQ